MAVMERTSVKDLATQVREAATVHGVFCEPVVADGVTIVPVALARADELAAAYGDRFRPTAYLRDLADQQSANGSFPR